MGFSRGIVGNAEFPIRVALVDDRFDRRFKKGGWGIVGGQDDADERMMWEPLGGRSRLESLPFWVVEVALKFVPSRAKAREMWGLDQADEELEDRSMHYRGFRKL